MARVTVFKICLYSLSCQNFKMKVIQIWDSDCLMIVDDSNIFGLLI